MTAKNVEKSIRAFDQKGFDIAGTLKAILPRGHSIHGYASASHERFFRILAQKEYADSAPLLGYGVDGTAERALGRALLSYVIRESLGLDYMVAGQFIEADEAKIMAGRNNSRFDNIVWTGNFRLFQEGAEVVAASSFGGEYGLSPMEVRAPTPLAAIVLFTDTYQYMNDSIARLPAISLE